jgi:hypothetical protein
MIIICNSSIERIKNVDDQYQRIRSLLSFYKDIRRFKRWSFIYIQKRLVIHVCLVLRIYLMFQLKIDISIKSFDKNQGINDFTGNV